ncbi:MAG: hypothetical protein ACTHLP_10560 [Rhizobiaceae bacterium]
MAGNGFFRSAFRALVDARMAQAERYVNEALLYLDDETLEARGYSRDALKRKGSRALFL